MAQALYYRAQGYEIIHYVNKPLHYPKHNHISVYTLGLVLDGSVTLITNDRKIEYFKDGFFTIKPLEPHELILPEKYSLVTVCFQQNFVLSQSPSQICHELSGILNGPAQADAELLMSALNVLFDEMTSAARTSESLSGSAKAMRLNPESRMDIEEMAQAEHISKYHFIRVFKQMIGITPHRFLLQNKVRKAQRLIENGMPLTDVALAAGFFDQSHFIKSFKKAVGLTPSEYKHACRKG